ncbi:MAG: hypothetical protein CMO66_01965 [Verrucomicrobiales bacterium]|nr:hypothetical protein [Verrucomicrobiales bacterium]|tara:strand:- start:156 stop:389 length:234 start_codon:yes stop_codon:yes gene_type:complete
MFFAIGIFAGLHTASTLGLSLGAWPLVACLFCGTGRFLDLIWEDTTAHRPSSPTQTIYSTAKRTTHVTLPHAAAPAH